MQRSACGLVLPGKAAYSSAATIGSFLLRLVVFDCDGTLVDSAATIVACAQAAFRAEGMTPPPDEAIRRIVGLSLVEACLRLLPEPDLVLAAHLAERYRVAFIERKLAPGYDEPLFPGAREVLDELARRGVPMGVATGKTMRGLRHILDHHDLEHYFVTLQTADLHPSKPHPAMLLAAMREAGAAAGDTILVGDTTFDIEMAVSAGARPIGVAWGNHDVAELVAAGAVPVLTRFDQLLDHVG